jgi:hypothetical protein
VLENSDGVGWSRSLDSRFALLTPRRKKDIQAPAVDDGLGLEAGVRVSTSVGSGMVAVPSRKGSVTCEMLDIGRIIGFGELIGETLACDSRTA